MSLVSTHQVQGSYTLSRPFRKRKTKSTQNLVEFCTFQRTDINFSKHTSCLCFQGEKYKDRIRGSQYANNSVKFSFISKENEETLSRLPKVHNNHAHPTSVSLAVHKLFKSWLTFLPLATQNQNETLEESFSNGSVKMDHKIAKSGILKTIWCNFSTMDVKLKIPAIIFIPLFLMVNMKYGAQVANELSPLWMIGPILVALYIKIIQFIYSLYVFSFKQSVKVVKDFSRGKPKESLQVRLWQHVVYFRNLDYKEESKRMLKEFQVWLGDKCLDYVESMWTYRKTIGVLKMVKIM